MSECGFFSVHVSQLVGRLFMMTMMWKRGKKIEERCGRLIKESRWATVGSIDRGT